MKSLFLLGRAIFGGYFVYSGINHFRHRQMMAGYAMSKKVPAADAAVVGSGLLLALGGLSLAAGVRPRIGGAMILTFLAGATPPMHNFWQEDEPNRSADWIHFGKNLGLAGATMMIMSIRVPWPLSVDAAVEGAESSLEAADQPLFGTREEPRVGSNVP